MILTYPLGVWAVIDNYTPTGYPSSMEKETADACLKRLNKIEGQVRGIIRMVEDERYCVDIVTQIAAARVALRRVEEAILKDHIGHCVTHAIASGSAAEQRKKIAELMDLVVRSDR